ncbi:MAG: lamin tail domain-containing protein, partial [Saprospiraceae bacterium]|nr:lamin tail domain-containing protein [Saprospiraceae bacterium]
IPVDTVVPLMDGVEIIDSQNILIAFTEALDPDAKLEIELKPKVGIESSTLVGDNQTLHITLKDALTNGNGYKLSLRGATDINGNRSPLLEVRFQYIRLAYASPYEILIHEIMADPSPPRALPECEFIELLNNSQKYFNLADYTIADDRSQAFLPDAILAPGEMVILCERTCFDQFMNFGRAIVVNDLPVINNGGDHLQLVDFAGRVIHAIEFDMTWYGDSERSGGGWSLEMRHPEDVCLGAPNWHAANYEDCGTPGKRNSVTIGEPSDRMMYIRKSIALDDHLVEVVFDRTLDLVQDDLKVWITPDRNIVQKEIMDNTLHLTTNERMQPGTPYKIRLEDVRSCLGVLERNDLHAEVYLPRPADSGDLVINEVLFDPRSGGVEFIEIRNVTSDYLSIDRLCIEVLDHKDTTFECIDEPIIIPDNGHLALSEDTTVLLSDYLCGELEVLNLPTLSDETAEIRCFQYDFGFRKPLDVMRYEASWHNPAYSSTEGVSLEKSEPADSGLKRSSWYSAASTSGYATPGLKNSIDIPFSSSERVLSLENEAFSPNGDGFKDYTVIHLHPDRPGYNLRLDIFDIEGRYVKRVANNAILGSDETFIWDGTDNDHRLQPIGLYLILAELAHPDGKMMREKATVVLN